LPPDFEWGGERKGTFWKRPPVSGKKVITREKDPPGGWKVSTPRKELRRNDDVVCPFRG